MDLPISIILTSGHSSSFKFVENEGKEVAEDAEDDEEEEDIEEEEEEEEAPAKDEL
jgi:hypothetical protein